MHDPMKEEVNVGFRETINKNQPLVIGVVLFAIALAAFVIFKQASGTTPKPPRDYLTVDDGATWFAAQTDEAAPLMVNGKEAVYARLYTCSDGKPRLGFLEKCVPEYKKALDEISAAKKAGKVVDYSKLEPFAGLWSRMYKKPGTKDWVNGTNAWSIMSVKCEDGSPAMTLK